jgi:pimeloyl-ACP methyl ester carboxylesterase
LLEIKISDWSFMLVLLVVLLILICTLLLFANQQACKLVHPKRSLALLTPDSVGIALWENVSFVTRDGLTLRGWFVPPHPDAHGATVVCAHGTGANRGHLLPQAKILTQAGYGVLLFDFRHHGQSDGRVSSFGIFEVHDLEASFDYLHSRPDVNPDRIAVIGHSMGGATALRAAARGLDAQALVVISAVSSLQENLAHGIQKLTRLPAFPLAPLVLKICEWHVKGRVSQMSPINDLEHLGERPLLLVYGERDALVPAENGQRLLQTRNHDTSLLVVRGAGHRSVLIERFLKFYEQELLNFLALHLQVPNVSKQSPKSSTGNSKINDFLVFD